MAVEHLFAGIPVADRDEAVAFYERLTGRPPDLIPNASEAAWQLTATSWVYVVVDAQRAGAAVNTLLVDAERAGAGVNTVLVDDLDGFLAGAEARGIAAGPIEIVGGSTRQSILTDGDGNRLKVGQVPA